MFGQVLIVLVLAASVASAGHALLHKRDPRSGLGWVAVCLTLPGIGAFLYWLLGINRIRTRARKYRRRRETPYSKRLKDATGDAAHHKIPHAGVPEQFLALDRIASAVTGEKLVPGNRVRAFFAGESVYSTMLGTIAAAERRVFLCSYIFSHDASGQAFVKALAEAEQRGVTVRVLVDGYPQLMSWPASRRLLREAGVSFAEFLPFSLLHPRIHVNLRNHRKLLVVDGHTGFTGGMNVSDRHLTQTPHNRHPVRDVHFMVQGPAVCQMERTFAHDWAFTTGERELLLDETAGSPQGEVGGTLCRAITDGPDEDLGRLLWVLLGACHAAHSRLMLMTPYFVPDKTLIAALCAAALRGVEVQIVLPRHSDHRVVDWATRALLWELLELGVEVYLQPPPFDHTKLLLVDELYALVGSANLDARSLKLNFEFNFEIYDEALCRELAAHIANVRDRAHRVSLEEMDARPLPVRLRDATAKLFSPYL